MNPETARSRRWMIATSAAGIWSLRKLSGPVTVLVLAALGFAACTGRAGARPSRNPAKPTLTVLHLRFRRVAGSRLLSDDDNVVIDGGSDAAGESAVLLGRTGRTQRIDTPGCEPQTLGGTWLIEACSASRTSPYGLAGGYGLINLTSARPGRLIPAPAIGRGPDCGPGNGCTPVAVGQDWLAQLSDCTDQADPEYCSPSTEYENLLTGRLATNPVARHTIADLNSADLAASLCPPLTVPFSPISTVDGNIPGLGSLSFDGPFAIVSGNGYTYLERCGSRRRELLDNSHPAGCLELACGTLLASDQEIVWASATATLEGIFLPTLRRFRITIPRTVDPTASDLGVGPDNEFQIGLTRRTLYLTVLGTGHVWSALIPNPDARNPKRRIVETRPAGWKR